MVVGMHSTCILPQREPRPAFTLHSGHPESPFLARDETMGHAVHTTHAYCQIGGLVQHLNITLGTQEAFLATVITALTG